VVGLGWGGTEESVTADFVTNNAARAGEHVDGLARNQGQHSATYLASSMYPTKESRIIYIICCHCWVSSD